MSNQEKRTDTRHDLLKKRLSQTREINITVTGRKSGRTISIPVWFVLEGRPTLPPAGAGLGDTVVQKRAQQSRDADQRSGR